MIQLEFLSGEAKGQLVEIDNPSPPDFIVGPDGIYLLAFEIIQGPKHSAFYDLDPELTAEADADSKRRAAKLN